MKKYLYTLFGAVFFAGVTYAAPINTYQTNLLPLANNTYDLGSTSPALQWKNLYAQNVTVSGTCTGCSSFSYPFPNNATSTTLIFNNGLISTASSTFSNLGTGAAYTQNGLLLSHATTSASVAYQDVWRDANQNAFAQNFVSAGTSFPTNGGTVTLTAASPRNWILTGTQVQTVKLPSGTTLAVGTQFMFNNNSTGVATVVDNGSNVLATILPGGSRLYTISDISTTNGSWDAHGWLGHKVYSGYNNLSIGTSSPFASLSIHANPTDNTVYTTLFAIGSSTATATTTLFSVSNIGTTTLGRFGACNTTSALTTDSSGNITCGAITGTTYTATWPITLSGTTFGFNGLATSSPIAAGGAVLYATGVNTLASIATSTPSIGSVLTYSGTLGNLVGGTSGTFGIANSSITNAMLTNSSITINGSSVSLGGSITVASTTLLGDTNIFSGLNSFANTLVGSSTIGKLVATSSLSVASSTGSQLLFDDGLFGNRVQFRDLNGSLYVGTSTYSNLATSTFSSLVLTKDGQLSTGEYTPATSTAMTVDWNATPNQVLLQIGTAAVTIGFNNASTTGMTKRIVVCNGGAAASTVTWSITSLLWSGGSAPTQTTTANKCDVYSFITSQSTSTSKTTVTIFGAPSQNF